MRKILLIMLAFVSLTGAAKKKQYPMTVMKASYDYNYAFTYKDGKNEWKHAVMILQIAPEQSRFFSVKTEFMDSLNSTAEGRRIYHQMIGDAISRGNGDVSQIDMPCKDVHTQVNKYFDKGEMTVIDFANMSDYIYTEPLDELKWTVGDSVKTVLGYECQQAFADYHGRRWEAWFAPDIPVQDGPWKLYGLPGLIMEACCDTRDHRFTITGLQKVAEPITPKPGNPIFEKTDRISFLKEKRAASHGTDQMLNALLRSFDMEEVRQAPSKPAEASSSKPAEVFHDYLETDYRD